MASRGAGYREILAKYFPTTRIANAGATGSADLMWEGRGFAARCAAESRDEGSCPKKDESSFRQTENAQRAATASQVGSPAFGSRRQTLSSEHFRISYPSNTDRREVERLLSLAQSSRRTLLARVASAGLNTRLPALEIFINETTGDFVGRTGQPPWAAAATHNHRIELQPLETLRRRRILETTVRHELVHTIIDSLGRGRAPRWLAEGLAIHFAGEGPLVSPYQLRHAPTMQEIEQKLANPKSAEDMRVAYAAAYNEVRRLIKNEGETSVWQRVANF
jgi:hypothetical protein